MRPSIANRLHSDNFIPVMAGGCNRGGVADERTIRDARGRRRGRLPHRKPGHRGPRGDARDGAAHARGASRVEASRGPRHPGWWRDDGAITGWGSDARETAWRSSMWAPRYSQTAARREPDAKRSATVSRTGARRPAHRPRGRRRGDVASACAVGSRPRPRAGRAGSPAARSGHAADSFTPPRPCGQRQLRVARAPGDVPDGVGRHDRFVKNEPLRRRFGSSGSSTIDFARRIASTSRGRRRASRAQPRAATARSTSA